MAESQSLGSVFDHVCSRAHAHKSGAASNEKVVIVARSEHSRLDTDEMPDVRRLLRLRGIHSNCPASHLIREDKRADKTGKYERVDAGCVPAFAEEGFCSNEHVYPTLLEN